MAYETEESLHLPPIGRDDFRDFENSEHQKAFNQICSTADALPADQVVGQIIHWPVADGRAYYRVIQEEPLIVQHIDYLDAWRIDPIMIKGLDKEDVLEKVDTERRRKAFFENARREAEARQ